MALVVWIYSGVPDGTPAFHHKLDYDASCSVIWRPSDDLALIRALHGRITKKDILDVAELLHSRYGVKVIDWERADGRKKRKYRVAERKWRSVAGS